MKKYKPETKKFKQLQEEIANLEDDAKCLISISVIKHGRVDSFCASQNYPVGDIPVSRSHFSEMLHLLYEKEFKARYEEEQLAAQHEIDEKAAKLRNMLE